MALFDPAPLSHRAGQMAMMLEAGAKRG